MDVVNILEKLQQLGLVRLNKVTGNYYSIYCPVHNSGQERRPSCGVLLHEEVRNGQRYPEGWTHCFTCGLSLNLPDLITEILKQRNLSTQSGLSWLQENIPGFEQNDFDYLIPRDVIKDLNVQFAVESLKLRTQQPPEFISEDELAGYRYTIDYMYDRKLTDPVIEKFDVGVDLHYKPVDRVREVPCITFPVRDKKGRVPFIYRRAIANKNFFMPQGIEKPVYGLYELPEDVKTVILCESIFNALTCYVYGQPALALFGTGTPAQVEELKRLGVREFALGLDPDDAGERGCSKLKKALRQVSIVTKMEIPKGKDINDLTAEEFQESFVNRM